MKILAKNFLMRVGWTSASFEDDFGINRTLEKYLQVSSLLDSDQHFSINISQYLILLKSRH